MKSIDTKFIFASVLTIASLVAGFATISKAASAELEDGIKGSGLYGYQRTWSANTVDFNNDGLEDIWLGYHQQVDSKLMRNNGDGTYTRVAHNVTARVNDDGGILDRHDCAWADVDHNGFKDMYCSGGRNLENYYKTAEKDNELWLQVSRGKFTEAGTEWGVGDPCGRGRFVAFLDLNNDGWEDLFVGNEKPRDVASPECDPLEDTEHHSYSKVFLNDDGERFVYAPQFATPNPSTGVNCAVPMDYNKDGWIDLLACNYKNTRGQLFRNNSGNGFTEVGSWNLSRLKPMTDAEYADITGDGIEDIVASDQKGLYYHAGTETGFDPTQTRFYWNNFNEGEALYGWGLAIGDINADGQMDVYGLIHDTTESRNPYDVVMLGNGYRAENTPKFRKLVVPPASGNASGVITVHTNPNEPAKFLVLNGQLRNDGPNQLIQYVPDITVPES